MMRRLFTCLLAVALSGAPSALFAQDASNLSEEERRTLGRLFTEARDAYTARDYVSSILKLERAYAIFPEPGILYRIAEMHESLGANDKAANFYSRYLAAKPDADDRDVIEARIARLSEPSAKPTELRRARMTVVTSPNGARLIVGDDELGTTPLEVEVVPGDYRVRVEKDGYQTLIKDLTLQPDELRTVEYDLTPIAVEAPVVTAPSEVDEGSSWPWALGLGATGLASAGASVAFFLVAADRQATLDAWDADRAKVGRPSNYDDVLDDELTFRALGWTFAGVAALSLGAATTIWLIADDSDSSAELRVTPGGAAVTGRW